MKIPVVSLIVSYFVMIIISFALVISGIVYLVNYIGNNGLKRTVERVWEGPK